MKAAVHTEYIQADSRKENLPCHSWSFPIWAGSIHSAAEGGEAHLFCLRQSSSAQTYDHHKLVRACMCVFSAQTWVIWQIAVEHKTHPRNTRTQTQTGTENRIAVVLLVGFACWLKTFSLSQRVWIKVLFLWLLLWKKFNEVNSWFFFFTPTEGHVVLQLKFTTRFHFLLNSVGEH